MTDTPGKTAAADPFDGSIRLQELISELNRRSAYYPAGDWTEVRSRFLPGTPRRRSASILADLPASSICRRSESWRRLTGDAFGALG
jgi:hypothetical protein